MDRKTIMAVVICFLIFMGWQKLYLEPHNKVAPPVQTQQTTQMPQTPAAQPQAPVTPGSAVAPRDKTSAEAPIGTPLVIDVLPLNDGQVQVSNEGKVLREWTLTHYKTSLGTEAGAVTLKDLTGHDGLGEIAFDLPEYSYLSNVHGTVTQNGQVISWKYEDANVRLERTVRSFENQPYVDMTLNADFKNKKPGYLFLSMLAESRDKDPEEQDRQLVYWSNKEIERVKVKDAGELKEPKGVLLPVKWIGATSRYFLAAIVSQGGVEPHAVIQPAGARTGRASLIYQLAGNSISIPLRAYFGPKDLDVLRAVEPTLDHTVDFGWFTVFAYPLLKILKWFYSLVHNYGIAIILLTLLVKLVTYPLTYKSSKSMKEMSRLQPQMAKIREKHKDDKEAQNREMLTLMKTHGYNPMAGCLPMLVQMPIFFALYRVLYSAIELYQAPFAFWIHDLSAKDPYYVTPVLLSGLMFIQQKMTPNTATDPVQAKMMQFMPLMFGAFMLTLPSGLTLYMLINAVVSILQQYLINKKLDAGHGPALARVK